MMKVLVQLFGWTHHRCSEHELGNSCEMVEDKGGLR